MSTSKSSSSSRSPTKRILTELAAYTSSPSQTITSLTPLPNNVLSLRAILVSPLPAYRAGRWLLSISIPPTYPVAPPTITFVTKICHPNINFETGEICLDLLGEGWTPVLGVVGALEAVGRLLGEGDVDSPLNVDVAALIRGGDRVGARGLVGFWSAEERFGGSIEDS